MEKALAEKIAKEINDKKQKSHLIKAEIDRINSVIVTSETNQFFQTAIETIIEICNNNKVY